MTGVLSWSRLCAVLKAQHASWLACRTQAQASNLVSGASALPPLPPPCTNTAEGLLVRGRVWALLGLARLHLLLPPAGADPAAKHGLARHHVLALLRCQVEPELAVRRQYAALPGGPDESARLAALEARAAELAAQAERLQRRTTPRPHAPQYLAVSPMPGSIRQAALTYWRPSHLLFHLPLH